MSDKITNRILDSICYEAKYLAGPFRTADEINFHANKILDYAAQLRATITRQQAAIKAAEAALKHYADEKNWKSGRGGTIRIFRCLVNENGYDKAREALKEKNEH